MKWNSGKTIFYKAIVELSPYNFTSDYDMSGRMVGENSQVSQEDQEESPGVTQGVTASLGYLASITSIFNSVTTNTAQDKKDETEQVREQEEEEEESVDVGANYDVSGTAVFKRNLEAVEQWKSLVKSERELQ